MPLRRSVLAAALALGLVACGHGGPAYGPPSTEAGAIVTMTTGLKFDPAEVTVQRGQTVEWRNRSIMNHTVTADPTKVRDASKVSLPAGAAAFDSGDIPPGEVWRHTFTTAGRYVYVCKPHEGQGMTGVVVVT